MPKLVYFDLQGRAQSIRYLLTKAGVAFEDQRLTNEEWAAAKAAKTYGENQLPVFIQDDGKILNQEKAILMMLAAKHGFACSSSEELFENMWYFETLADFANNSPPASRFAIFMENPPAEAIDTAVEGITKQMKTLNARWADGRAHAAGASLTAADFHVVALHV